MRRTVEKAFTIFGTEREGRPNVMLSELFLERINIGERLVPTPL